MADNARAQNENYEPSDSPDLTPSQLASFYRELHGNYDQLFLGTPGASIAFIYKSLGCQYSLQPLPHSTAFTEPTVPALKTEGWIMWQTIQILLGPEEHSKFLMDAVERWDIKDPATGQVLPKILPRECLPMEPDKHMVMWYEGVSERLRKEAEDEEMARLEAERADSSRVALRPEEPPTDDEGSVDSRGPALAYFRNPLYRHVDGRPTIVRKESKRPALSPRHSMMDKGKEAAASVGHFARNVASPHLWDGHGGSRTGSRSRDRERDRSHRRRSVPDHKHAHSSHHFPGDLPPPEREPQDDRLSPVPQSRHRRRSSRSEHRPLSAGADEDWEADESGSGAVYSPQPSPRPPSSGHRHRPASHDSRLRHSRSHDPTPSQKEYDDYFQGVESPPQERRRRASAYAESPDAPPVQQHQHRRTSAAEPPQSPEPTPPQPEPSGVGPSFGPSTSPLFASHVARHPQPPPPRHPRHPYDDSRSPSRSRYDSPRRAPPPGRPPYDDRPPRDARYDSYDDRPPRDPRYDSPARGPPYDDRPPRDPRYDSPGRGPPYEDRPPRDPRYDSPARGPPPPHAYPDPRGSPYGSSPADTMSMSSGRRPRRSDASRRSGDLPPPERRSGDLLPDRRRGSMVEREHDSAPEGPRPGKKQARFAQGVDGRRYPGF